MSAAEASAAEASAAEASAAEAAAMHERDDRGVGHEHQRLSI